MLGASTGLDHITLARLSLCLSLRQQGIPNPDEYNLDGGRITIETLFGIHDKEYRALFICRLKKDRLDIDTYLNEMIRSHINRGAIGLKQRIKSLSDINNLIQEAQND